MYRYYVTQREPSPGAVPNSKENPITDTGIFMYRKYIEEIDRNAWGWVEYKKPLTDREFNEYELVRSN